MGICFKGALYLAELRTGDCKTTLEAKKKLETSHIIYRQKAKEMLKVNKITRNYMGAYITRT